MTSDALDFLLIQKCAACKNYWPAYLGPNLEKICSSVNTPHVLLLNILCFDRVLLKYKDCYSFDGLVDINVCFGDALLPYTGFRFK